MTPSQRDPALKPSVFPNLGRGLPAAASAGQPQAEPRHRAASLGSRALVADSARQGQERLLGRPPCALCWEGHGWCFLSPRTTFVWLLLRVDFAAILLINAFPKSGVGAGMSSMTGSLLLR